MITKKKLGKLCKEKEEIDLNKSMKKQQFRKACIKIYFVESFLFKFFLYIYIVNSPVQFI